MKANILELSSNNNHPQAHYFQHNWFTKQPGIEHQMLKPRANNNSYDASNSRRTQI